MSEEKEPKINNAAFESLSTLYRRWKDGTFMEIIDDWKWIFGYSLRYKWIIAYSLFLGILSTTLGLIGSVINKYLIDIITGYQTDKLWILITLGVANLILGLVISPIMGRINLKISIYLNNDIQSDLFDKIIDSDWGELNKYSK